MLSYLCYFVFTIKQPDFFHQQNLIFMSTHCFVAKAGTQRDKAEPWVGLSHVRARTPATDKTHVVTPAEAFHFQNHAWLPLRKLSSPLNCVFFCCAIFPVLQSLLCSWYLQGPIPNPLGRLQSQWSRVRVLMPHCLNLHDLEQGTLPILNTGIHAASPGGPVITTPCFQHRGLGFDPWFGN